MQIVRHTGFLFIGFLVSHLRIWSLTFVVHCALDFDGIIDSLCVLGYCDHFVEVNRANLRADHDLEYVRLMVFVLLPLGLQDHTVQAIELDVGVFVFLVQPGPVEVRDAVDYFHILVQDRHF